MIHVENVSVHYRHTQDFKVEIPNLTIFDGDCIVICGKSGSGKSTFLRLLNGLIPEYYEADCEGTITIDGESVWNQSVEDLSFKVGTVFQNPATQFFHRQVEAELVFPCENQGLPPHIIKERLQRVTELLQIDSLLQKELLQLSGGERQKIALATALMQQPKILLLDEPTANLDEEGIKQLQEALLRVKKSGITIIISEHRLYFLKELADRYVYFDRGRLTTEWDAQTFMTLTTDERIQLGLRSRRKQFVDKPLLVSDQTGLTLQEVTTGHGHFKFTIPTITFCAGAITGIVGENGSGKTTLLNTIAGLIKPRTGVIKWDTEPLHAKERIKQTAFVMQDVRLQFVTPTVKEEIELGDSIIPKDRLRLLGLLEVLERHPLSLSGGQQQRVMIANAIGLKKRIYLFDEPTSGLDYEQMIEVSQLLKKIAQEDNVVVVVSHDDEFLEACCDVILPLSRTV